MLRIKYYGMRQGSVWRTGIPTFRRNPLPASSGRNPSECLYLSTKLDKAPSQVTVLLFLCVPLYKPPTSSSIEPFIFEQTQICICASSSTSPTREWQFKAYVHAHFMSALDESDKPRSSHWIIRSWRQDSERPASYEGPARAPKRGDKINELVRLFL